ncbi:MAG: prephenate dehydrogenase/arogenate dehydrogenase family protein [Anaerolineales bacterium]|nr:prephenate dehydrogenase/arogenate dehydrogenase family protein [Anaerolineales bacterium]
MEPDFNLKDANIAIIGLGLMGGSLALSLKGRCRRLSAYDPDQSTLELASRQEIVHFAADDPAKILADAALVILACPVPAIVDWLGSLHEYIQHPCIVLDIGSSKRTIVSALKALPANFDPIGGHPICGRERLSLENAERFLYRDAPFVLTPLHRTSQRARSAVLQIVAALGARPIWLDAGDHDRILASTSHLPYLLSSALALATPEECAPLIGPGFSSSARLAGTPSNMMLGVLQSNRDNLLDALDRLQEQIATIKSALIVGDFASLQATLDAARDQYQQLLTEN